MSYTLAACGVGGLSYVLLRDNEDLSSPRWTGGTYAAAIVATLGLGLLAMVAWWRYGDAAQKASPWPYQWRVLKVGCVLAVIGLLPDDLAAASWASEKYRERRRDRAHLRLHDAMERDRSEIYIRGGIGPIFATSFVISFARDHGPPDRHREPGRRSSKKRWKSASSLEKDRLRIVARETCNSACILILLAAHKRYADWDMDFGFHVPVELLPDSDGNLARRRVPH